MPIIPALLPRADSTDSSISPSTMNLLIAIIVLLLVSLCLTAGLFVLRSRRKAMQSREFEQLPFQAHRPTSKISHHRSLTVTTSLDNFNPLAHTAAEKEALMQQDSPVSPSSPLPEIRITFPEEEDDGGKRKAGRVVVVRISDKGGVGFEPYNDEHLPPYQQADSERFQSLDLQRIGGLKELEKTPKM